MHHMQTQSLKCPVHRCLHISASVYFNHMHQGMFSTQTLRNVAYYILAIEYPLQPLSYIYTCIRVHLCPDCSVIKMAFGGFYVVFFFFKILLMRKKLIKQKSTTYFFL